MSNLIAQEGDVLSLIVTYKVEEDLEALFPGVSIVPYPTLKGGRW